MAGASERLSVSKAVVLTCLGLALLALSDRPFSWTPQPLTTETFAKETQLTCEEILKITLWVGKQYGGPKQLSFQSPEATDLFLDVFLEKLDPGKMLFLRSEVEDFKSGGRKQWDRLIQEGACGFFDAWVRAHYPVAKRRLFDLASHLPLEKIFRESAEQGEDEARPSKFEAFVATPKELFARLELVARSVAKNTSPDVIAAYHSDKRQVLFEALNENLFESIAAPPTLVAKALLGTFDPYSTYFSTTEFEDFYSDLSAGTTGLGIRIQKVPQGFLIEKVVKDSSAAASKQIREGDIITAIDGVRLENISMQEVRQFLKGEAGAPITLELTNLQQTHSKKVSLLRKHFDFQETKVKEKENGTRAGIVVVEVPNFYGKAGFEKENEENSSAMDLRKILDNVARRPQKAQGLVLDLRGNPGGFLDEAVSMAGMFVGRKPVVGVVEHSKTRVMQDEMASTLYQGPLVVLVDEGTASAGEVLAGALKDLQRAVVVGSPQTYGKGSVQKLFHLDEDLLQVGLKHPVGNGVVKLTTSVFYSPLGHSPANGGVVSDIPFPVSLRRETGGEYGQAAKMDVPDVHPFLDDLSLSELRLKDQIRQKTLALLRGKSEKRMQRILSENDDDTELNEAVSIAWDLSRFSHADLQ